MRLRPPNRQRQQIHRILAATEANIFKFYWLYKSIRHSLEVLTAVSYSSPLDRCSRY